ncbi:MAG: hypothetical protein B6I22_02510 [Desulfobacteraceae bacterium 4572_123]|nr:MAG: hypothetical protein B6I22_02510 [Desulfobacteraceae bacterium 4572_123]
MEEKKDFILKEQPGGNEQNAAAESTDASENDPANQEATGFESGEGDSRLPAINFATFIFSLNSSALVQLGMMDDPGSGKKVKNLPLAKQTIDIIGMLEEKTRGNLDEDEKNMLKHILYDLRILYVKEKG